MSARPRIGLALGLALLVLFGACGVAAWRTGLLSTEPIRPDARRVLTRDDPAPELKGIAAWINAEPLTMRRLRGKVVLIDFWTYSCVNCVRTLPERRSLYATYRDAGLEIVGVHAPEFAFEKSRANVERAVRDRGVSWPVALDNDRTTWNAYRNRHWPHVYVVDRAGRIRFDWIGEGGGPRIEAAIRRLLGEAAPAAFASHAPGPSAGITPEVYLGYERGVAFFGNAGGFVRDRPSGYRLPSDDRIRSIATGAFFLDGEWTAVADRITAAAAGARIVLSFTARDVYVVAGASGRRIEVTLDGRPLASAGPGGIVRVDRHDLYPLVAGTRVESHELAIRALEPGVSLYTFTFG